MNPEELIMLLKKLMGVGELSSTAMKNIHEAGPAAEGMSRLFRGESMPGLIEGRGQLFTNDLPDAASFAKKQAEPMINMLDVPEAKAARGNIADSKGFDTVGRRSIIDSRGASPARAQNSSFVVKGLADKKKQVFPALAASSLAGYGASQAVPDAQAQASSAPSSTPTPQESEYVDENGNPMFVDENGQQMQGVESMMIPQPGAGRPELPVGLMKEPPAITSQQDQPTPFRDKATRVAQDLINPYATALPSELPGGVPPNNGNYPLDAIANSGFQNMAEVKTFFQQLPERVGQLLGMNPTAGMNLAKDTLTSGGRKLLGEGKSNINWQIPGSRPSMPSGRIFEGGGRVPVNDIHVENASHVNPTSSTHFDIRPPYGEYGTYSGEIKNARNVTQPVKLTKQSKGPLSSRELKPPLDTTPEIPFNLKENIPASNLHGLFTDEGLRSLGKIPDGINLRDLEAQGQIHRTTEGLWELSETRPITPRPKPENPIIDFSAIPHEPVADFASMPSDIPSEPLPDLSKLEPTVRQRLTALYQNPKTRAVALTLAKAMATGMGIGVGGGKIIDILGHRAP